jgi:L-alanine-DL-glutamate epimerase-like enolase superfamily enzyme
MALGGHCRLPPLLAYQAREAGVMFTPHSWTNGIDVLANAHLTAGAGDAPFLEDPFDI